MKKKSIGKIVIDGRLYGWEHAGPGRYVKNLIDSLCKIDKSNEYFILLRKKYYDSTDFPVNFHKVLADYPHYTFLEQIKLPLLIYRIKPDLVHFPFFNTPILYFGNFIVTIHDLTMHRFTGGTATTRSYLKNLIWRLGYHIAFANAVYRAKMVLVPSNYVKEDLSRFYRINRNKITVTYEGVAESITKPAGINVLEKYQVKKKYFIYSGSAYPHKNLANAIKAIKILNDETDELVLLVITSPRGIFAERLLKQVKNLKAERFVKYIGFVSDAELGSLFNKSLAFIYPTKSEGFGLPGLEAMQAETLLICSNIAVLKEVYDEKAIYFDPNDAGDIKDAMEMVLNMDDGERVKRIAVALDFLKRYSWVNTVRETIRIYQLTQKVN
jgi:glycosyltransferase involved in cell wall biosynthesis